MAINLTPEEIQEKMSQLFEDFDNKRITAQQLNAGMKDLKVGILGFGDELKKLKSALGSSATQIATNMAQGAQGQAAFNAAISTGGNAVGDFAMQFGPAGIAIGLFIKAITFGISEINKITDGLFKANQDLAGIGALSGGMMEVKDQMRNFGLGLNEAGFATLNKVLGQNAVSLSNMAGSANLGAKQFGRVVDELKPLQNSFITMGLSIEAQAEGIGDYLSIQTTLGQAQRMTTQELAAGSADYLKNMSTLSKLTGESANALKKTQQDALTIESFYAKLRTLPDTEQKNQLARYAVLNKIDKDMAVGYAGLVSGRLGQSKQANQIFQATHGVAARLALDSKMALGQFVVELGNATGGTMRLQQGLALSSNSSNTFGRIQSNVALMELGRNKKALDAAIHAANATEANAAGMDPLTKGQADFLQQQNAVRDEFQDMAFKWLPEVNAGFQGLYKIIHRILHPFTSYEESLKQANQRAQDRKDLASAGPISGSVEQVLATIKKRESSGGNYNAQARTGSASGAYQFIDSTWQSLTKKYGMGTQYAKAKLAPKEIQDQIAAKYVQEILDKNGGDISKVPLVWYTGNAQGQMSPQQLAANSGLRAETYQAKWMNEFKKTSSSSGYNGTSVTGASSQIKGDLDDNSPVKTSANKSTSGMSYDQQILAQQKQTNDHLARIAKSNQQILQNR